MSEKLSIEVCISPAIFDKYVNKESNVVVIDVFRATSSVCTGFKNGLKELIPIADKEDARKMKEQGFLVAAERNGIKLDFADFGNSPYNFSKENVEGKTIVYSTTNGTKAIQKASECNKVVLASFLNLSAVCEYLISEKRNIIVLCAGWKTKLSLEDTVLAGAITEKILESNLYYTKCDTATTALDLWSLAKVDLVQYMQKAAQRDRLRQFGLDDVIEYCLQIDTMRIIPYYDNGKIFKMDY